MTPIDIIEHEEIILKEKLKQDVSDIITNHIQNFIDKTGWKIRSVKFGFLDVSSIDKKRIIFDYLDISKDII